MNSKLSLRLIRLGGAKEMTRGIEGLGLEPVTGRFDEA